MTKLPIQQRYYRFRLLSSTSSEGRFRPVWNVVGVSAIWLLVLSIAGSYIIDAWR